MIALALALVDVLTVAPHVRLDLRYATPNNFTHHKLYAHARCLLQAPVAARLAAVQRELEARGLGLLLYDCYRPRSVQRRMWQLVPDPRYVADPAQGSRHNRGASVDVTLVDAHGHPLPMPTPFDDFTPRAHRDYSGATPRQRHNRALLQQVMTNHGFVPLPTEWWHFDAPDWPTYPLLDTPL